MPKLTKKDKKKNSGGKRRYRRRPKQQEVSNSVTTTEESSAFESSVDNNGSSVSRSYQNDALSSSQQGSIESSYSATERSYKSKKTSSRNGSNASSTPKEKEYTQQELNTEANVAWEEVEFIGSMVVNKKDLLNSKGELKGDGTLKFSLENGTLKYGRRTNASDFTPINVQKKREKGSGEGLSSQSNGNHDIVKSIEFSAFTLKGYDEEFLISVNVPKFQSEGFYNESPTVNKIILPQELNAPNGQYVQVLTRKITNAVILFQNNFPGISPETYQKHIQRCDDKYSLVNLESPILAIYNAEQKDERKKHLKATKGLEKTKQVMLSNTIISKYEVKATEAMKRQISYANITGGFEVDLSAVIPAHKLEDHHLWLKSKGTKGKAFLAWADNCNVSSSSKIKDFDSSIGEKAYQSSSDSSQFIEARFRCVVKYLKITDKPVEINI